MFSMLDYLFIFLLTNFIYMGIVTYAPALALSATTEISDYQAAILTAFICTLYTFVGGLKAVIWVDVFQALIIMGGFFCLILVGSGHFGGVSNIMAINQAGGRIILDDIRLDPSIKHTIWSVVLSGTFGVWGSIYTNQSMIQSIPGAG